MSEYAINRNKNLKKMYLTSKSCNIFAVTTEFVMRIDKELIQKLKLIKSF